MVQTNRAVVELTSNCCCQMFLGKRLGAVDPARLVAMETATDLINELCVQVAPACSLQPLSDYLTIMAQVLAQHQNDVDKRYRLKRNLNSAASQLNEVQLQKEQIISDKLQLEDKLNWMKHLIKNEERAYSIIKKNFRPWILWNRVHQLLRGGDAEAFRLNSQKRECKVIDIVYLLGNYGKQLQILHDVYCRPMEQFYLEKAYTLLDPNGFQLQNFQEYSLAVRKMALLYKQVENEASFVI